MDTTGAFVEMASKLKVIASIAGLSILWACSHQDCSNIPRNPIARKPEEPKSAITSGEKRQVVAEEDRNPEKRNKKQKGPTVEVYKPTGAKQCGVAKGVPLSKVKSSLERSKIPVIEAHTQSDGKMHIAVCGAPSGTIHVFKIPKKSLPKAKGLGFRLLK